MSAFAALFGRPATVVADAPGRVNLIGEHTDHSGGLVLPTAVPQRTTVALAPRGGDEVRVASASVAPGARAYRLGAEAPGRDWLDYVQGVTCTLRLAGHAIGGFDALVTSGVPVGSGLASSAALEVALLRALRLAFGLALDDVTLALVGQRAENEFVGARVGVMDQLAASLADEATALFIDTRSLAVERVPLPRGCALVVVDSGVAHGHATGEYNARRADCERAAELLGVASLRDVAAADVRRLAALPPPLDRRARHVVTENERVRAAISALHAGDAERLGALLDASHVSLRDDFEVSTPEIDVLVKVARRTAGVYGARLTGGGFGGSILALATPERAATAGAEIVRAYRERSGRAATLLVPPPAPLTPPA